MTDITKCAGEGFVKAVNKYIVCFRRNNCYRFTARADEFRQSWFAGIPVNVEYDEAGEETQQCDELWLNDKMFGGL